MSNQFKPGDRVRLVSTELTKRYTNANLEEKRKILETGATLVVVQAKRANIRSAPGGILYYVNVRIENEEEIFTIPEGDLRLALNEDEQLLHNLLKGE